MSEQLLREYIAESLFEHGHEEVDELIGRAIGGIVKGAKAGHEKMKAGERLGTAMVNLDAAGVFNALADLTPAEIKLFVTKRMYGAESPEHRKELKLKLEKNMEKKEQEIRDLTAKIKSMKTDDKVELPDGNRGTQQEAKEYEDRLRAELQSLKTARSDALYLANDLDDIDMAISKLKPQLVEMSVNDGNSLIRKATIDVLDNDSGTALVTALRGDPSDAEIQEFYNALISKFGGRTAKMGEDNVRYIQGRLARELKSLENV